MMSGLAWFLAGPFVYFAGIVCVIGAAGKFFSYWQMPRHIRWDLYPVPHQGPAGSKYQKLDFYKFPYQVSKVHEMKEMSQEMFFLKKALVNNPSLWKGSFPLHMGIYLWGAWLALLAAGALGELSGMKIHLSGTALAAFIYVGTVFCGVGGLASGFWGALSLLRLRYSNEGLRAMSTFTNYLSLYIMLFLFGSGLSAWLATDTDFSLLRLHIASLLLLHPVMPPHPLITLEMSALSVFLLYLPFSQMMHFAAKYFFHHKIMWDDEPMTPGSKMAADIGGYLHYQISWAAAHIKKSGSWLDQATGQKSGGEPRQ